MKKPTPKFPLCISVLSWAEWQLESQMVDEGLFSVIFPRDTQDKTIHEFMNNGRLLNPIRGFEVFVCVSYRKMEGKLEEVFQKAKDEVRRNDQESDFKTYLIRITDANGEIIGTVQSTRGFCMALSDFL